MFVPTLALLLAAQPACDAPGGHPAPPLLERVAVLGASMSAGFNLKAELGVITDLSDVVACVLTHEPASLVVASDAMFFLDASGRGPQLVDRVLEARPSVVLALDYLFWFGYGELAREDQRLELFERGLAQLDRLACPLVVGDLPDVSIALEGTSAMGPLIAPSQIPRPETLERLNQRLAAWARERGDVVLVPLSRFLGAAERGERIELRGNVFEPGSLERLLQPDRLHPTVDGSIAVLLLAFDELARAREVPSSAFDWELSRVRERLLERAAAQRIRHSQARVEQPAGQR